MVTTPFGIRGMLTPEPLPAIVSELEEFATRIQRFAETEEYNDLLDRTSRDARLWCEMHRSWSAVGEAFAAAIGEVVPRRRTEESKEDRVGVLIPMLNAEPFIEECLESVLDQTHQNLEVLVVDDGCSDRSPDIVRAIGARDSRVRLLQHPHRENHGISRSIELALRHSRSRYVAFLDADDAFEREKIQKQISAMRAHPSAILCHTLVKVVADEETELSRSIQVHFDDEPSAPLYWLLKEPRQLGMCHVLKSSVLIKSPVLRKLHFGGRQVYQSEDWLILAMLATEGPFLFLPERLTRYRIHPQSYTSRVLTDPIKNLYARLEMFLRLLPHSKAAEITSIIEHHMDGVLWSLESEYERDAPMRTEPPPLKYKQASQARIEALVAQADSLERELQAIQQSRSWRVTAPIRLTIDQLKRFKRAIRLKR